MSEKQSVVGVFNSHEEAEEAVKGLQRSGLDMKRLSIVGRDFRSEEHVVGYYNTGDRMTFWASSAPSGEASGDCCSARPSSGSLGSARSWSVDHSSPRSSGGSRGRPSWVD